jgi:hypothetical protein
LGRKAEIYIADCQVFQDQTLAQVIRIVMGRLSLCQQSALIKECSVCDCMIGFAKFIPATWQTQHTTKNVEEEKQTEQTTVKKQPKGAGKYKPALKSKPAQHPLRPQ